MGSRAVAASSGLERPWPRAPIKKCHSRRNLQKAREGEWGRNVVTFAISPLRKKRRSHRAALPSHPMDGNFVSGAATADGSE